MRVALRLAAFVSSCVAMFLALILVKYVVVGTPVITYRDNIVEAGHIRRPWDSIAVHSSEESFIRIAGKSYRRVRGTAPFYLKLPTLGAVIFVTDSSDEIANFHIVKLAGNSALTIAGEKLAFGTHIGDPEPPGSPYTDFIEKEDWHELVLATKYPNAKTLVFLDLDKERITKVTYDEYDAAGHVVAHHVYVNNKQIQ